MNSTTMVEFAPGRARLELENCAETQILANVGIRAGDQTGRLSTKSASGKFALGGMAQFPPATALFTAFM